MANFQTVTLKEDVDWDVKTHKAGTRITPNREFLEYLKQNNLIEEQESKKETKSFKEFLSNDLNERDYGSE
jgi:flagellar biogenesis protein FliO